LGLLPERRPGAAGAHSADTVVDRKNLIGLILEFVNPFLLSFAPQTESESHILSAFQGGWERTAGRSAVGGREPLDLLPRLRARLWGLREGE
jgi:hypothetical protein